jgi:hypothetical protein
MRVDLGDKFPTDGDDARGFEQKTQKSYLRTSVISISNPRHHINDYFINKCV